MSDATRSQRDTLLDDFETECRAGRRPDPAGYADRVPAADRTALLRELVLLDLEYRVRAGEAARAEAVFARFPEVAADPDAQTELIAHEYRVRWDCGERPAAAEYLERFPTLGDSLPAALRVVRAGPPDVPGYELFEEIGRGGMGVVYRARDVRLNRPVALKMILAGGHAAAEERERLRTEAEAIARLRHPAVVHVYEAGECGGLPFVALELCAGGSLDKRLAAGPLPPADAAALVSAVARGVQAAHDAGVIHRDLKPANVLLSGDRGQETGDRGQGTGDSPKAPTGNGRRGGSELSPVSCPLSPKVTDFGLAKCLDATARTRSGAVFGTPSYMAPEQATGAAGSSAPAVDVHALGAILYECLTGRPPFRAATAVETLRQVTTEEPVPPRQLNPAVPRDLETVCLACVRKEPARRFASAAEVADDLDRFLRGEPIRARPVGTAERAAKWVRRNPAVSALLCGLAVTAAAAIVAAGVARREWVRADDNADRAGRLAVDERAARARAESARGRASDVLDVLTSDMTGESLAAQRAVTAEQKKLLAEVLPFYQEMAGEDADGEPARARTARAANRLALVQYRLGRKNEAAAAFARSVELYEGLARDFPESGHLRALANSLSNRGSVHLEFGERADAERLFLRVFSLRQQVLAQRPAEAELRNELAGAHLALGNVYQDATNRVPEARREYEAAVAIRTTVVSENPKNAAYRADLARVHNNLGTLLTRADDLEAAEPHNRKALELRAALAKDDPALRRELANTRANFGLFLKRAKKYAEAEEQHRLASALFGQLAAEAPGDPRPKVGVGACHLNLGVLFAETGRESEGLAELDRAVGLLTPLGHDPQAKFFLSSAHQNRAGVFDRTGRYAEAAREWDRVAGLVSPEHAPRHRVKRALSRCRAGQVSETVAELDELTKADNWAAEQWCDLARAEALVSARLPAEAERHAAFAVQLLNRAVRAGLPNATQLGQVEDFQALRARDDFQRLIREFERK